LIFFGVVVVVVVDIYSRNRQCFSMNELGMLWIEEKVVAMTPVDTRGPITPSCPTSECHDDQETPEGFRG